MFDRSTSPPAKHSCPMCGSVDLHAQAAVCAKCATRHGQVSRADREMEIQATIDKAESLAGQISDLLRDRAVNRRKQIAHDLTVMIELARRLEFTPGETCDFLARHASDIEHGAD